MTVTVPRLSTTRSPGSRASKLILPLSRRKMYVHAPMEGVVHNVKVNLTVPPVAEAARAHPRQPVTAHRAADLPLRDDAHGSMDCLDERDLPRRSGKAARAAGTFAREIDDETVAAALRPADNPAMHGAHDRCGHCRRRAQAHAAAEDHRGQQTASSPTPRR